MPESLSSTSSTGLGFRVSRDRTAIRSWGQMCNGQVQGRRGLTVAGLKATAASLWLSCLGGISTPAAAFPYREYVPFWGFGIESYAPKSHYARRRHGTAKTAESAKLEPPKPPAGPLILAVSIGSQRVTVYDG